MREGIQLEAAEGGVPVARVPGEVAWDLVEYLSNQRVHVVYSFEQSRVLVRFNHIDMRTAADLLDQWIRAEKHEELAHPKPPRGARALSTAQA